MGTQHITLSNVGAEAVLHGHSLLFPKKGICEIKGVSTSCLIDIRYEHLLQSSVLTRSFASYLFEGLSVCL